jgi:hypothetical protein
MLICLQELNTDSSNEQQVPIPVAARSKACVCDCQLAGTAASNPAGARVFVCCQCCVLSSRGLCVELITRPEESYRVWCVWVWSWSLEQEKAPVPWGLLRSPPPPFPKKTAAKPSVKSSNVIHSSGRYVTLIRLAPRSSLERTRKCWCKKCFSCIGKAAPLRERMPE